MEVISWKNMPISTEIIHVLIRQNTIPYGQRHCQYLRPYGIVFGHKSVKGWQLGYYTATIFATWSVKSATTFCTRYQVLAACKKS